MPSPSFPLWSRPGAASGTGRRRGFTLIELLVVIAVIAVLAALTMPVLLRAVNIAEVTKCGGNLRQIGQAVSMYTANNGLFLPTTPRNSTVTVGGAPGHMTNYTMKDRPLNKYLGEGSVEVFHCPADGGCQDPIFFNLESFWWGYGNSYVYQTFDYMLGDPTNGRTGKTILHYKDTASVSFLMGDACVYGFSVTVEAAGVDPSAAFGKWHDEKVKANVLFVDLHTSYIQMRYGESWEGFSWR